MVFGARDRPAVFIDRFVHNEERKIFRLDSNIDLSPVFRDLLRIALQREGWTDENDRFLRSPELLDSALEESTILHAAGHALSSLLGSSGVPKEETLCYLQQLTGNLLYPNLTTFDFVAFINADEIQKYAKSRGITLETARLLQNKVQYDPFIGVVRELSFTAGYRDLTDRIGHWDPDAIAKLLTRLMRLPRKSLEALIKDTKERIGKELALPSQWEISRVSSPASIEPRANASSVFSAGTVGVQTNQDISGPTADSAASPTTDQPGHPGGIDGSASSPSIPQAANPGGIDFRALPIVTQAIGNLSANLSKVSLERFSSVNLAQEWQQIERMANSGITPSSERIKEYIQTSCAQDNITQDKDKILLCISDILRLEEERCDHTNATLRDILVVLESMSNTQELRKIFLGTIS